MITRLTTLFFDRRVPNVNTVLRARLANGVGPGTMVTPPRAPPTTASPASAPWGSSQTTLAPPVVRRTAMATIAFSPSAPKNTFVTLAQGVTRGLIAKGDHCFDSEV